MTTYWPFETSHGLIATKGIEKDSQNSDIYGFITLDIELSEEC